jgi:hypothetical protein
MTMLTRRNLLKSLLAPLALDDPERLLWIPGRKVISIPSYEILRVTERRPWGNAVGSIVRPSLRFTVT